MRRFRDTRRFPATSKMMAMAFGMAISLIGPVAAQDAPAPRATASAAADTLIGQVVLDGQPLGGIPVTLHRVSPESSGDLATSATDPDGTFSFPLEPVPGAAFNVFFVTAEHLSVRYFGDPVHLDQARGEYTVAVYDTTSSPAAPARISRRDIVLLPQTNESWEVNEIISVLNPNERAIVGDSGMPTLEIPIPEGATDYEAGEGDILPHEVSFMENRVLLLTPVIPGRRDLWLRYRLPAQPARAAYPLVQATDTFNLYALQPSHLTSVEGLGTMRMIDVDGEQFLQYGATGIPAGADVELEWTGGAPVDPVAAAVAVTLTLLASGAWVAARNRRPIGPV